MIPRRGIMPSGITSNPPKNRPGRIRNERMPRYGFREPSPNYTRNKNSHEIAPLVVNKTPVKLMTLFDK